MQDTENKEKAIGAVGNNRVRENGMCMTTAGAYYTWNTDGIINGGILKEINNGTIVIRMDSTKSHTLAKRTDFGFRMKRNQIFLKQDLC